MRFIMIVVSAAIVLGLALLGLNWILSYWNNDFIPGGAFPDAWTGPDSWSEWRDIMIVFTAIFWLVAGVFAGSMLWWAVLAGAVGVFREGFLRSGLTRLNQVFGAIIALSPALNPQQKAVYNSWGPGKYDPRFNLDGMNGPQVISPAFGLQGIHKITATGDGDNLAYWNRYVGVTQMGGHGNFTDGRLGSTGVSVTNGNDDQVSARLAALQAYQLSIPAPAAPIGSFDGAAAERGRVLFKGVAGCASCHSGPEFTDANERLHDPTEVASEPEAQGVPSYASRTATGKYRSAPLKGVWQHPPYFHNGSAATLEDVVRMYNTKNSLDLTETEIADLAQYLKSL